MKCKTMHVLLAELFFAQPIYQNKDLFSNNCNTRLGLIKSIPDSVHCEEKLRKYQTEFDKKNLFIDGLGQVHMYCPELYPFVPYYNSNEDLIENRRKTSVYYGVKTNFTLTLAIKGFSSCTCKIQPIIHIFTNKMVNIIFSCYITTKDQKADLTRFCSCLMDLFYASNSHKKPKDASFSCVKDIMFGVDSFDQLTEIIYHKLARSFPEYESIQRCDRKKYTFTNLIAYELEDPSWKYETMNDDTFEHTVKKISGISYVDTVNRVYEQRGYDPAFHKTVNTFRYIDKSRMVYVSRYSAGRNSKRMAKWIRYDGWYKHATYEFIQMSDLLLQCLARRARTLNSVVQRKNAKLISGVKFSYYDVIMNQLLEDQIGAYHSVSGYMRESIYCFYGGKSAFREEVQEVENLVSKADLTTASYKSVIIQLLNRLIDFFA